MTFNIPIREGKPGKSIVCGNALHRKSEYYCSKTCYDAYHANTEQEKPPVSLKMEDTKTKKSKRTLCRAPEKNTIEDEYAYPSGETVQKTACRLSQSSRHSSS